MAREPEGIQSHAADYKAAAWEGYTLAELGWWVHLLATRSQHRADAGKKAKDLHDAQNYLSMMQSKLDALKDPSGGLTL